MRIKLRPPLLTAGLLLLSACRLDPQTYADKVPLISFDEKGEVKQVLVAKNRYMQNTQALATTTQDSLVPVLEKQNVRTGWMLRTFALGLGANVEVGVGSAFMIGANPRFRMIFTNSSQPPLP